MALARAIARRPLTGRRVIELGCGLGLPAIAAALAGGRVLATDWSPDAVAMTARNAARNDARARDRRLPLGRRRREALGPPWPLVLASDVLYEPRNVPTLLLALLPRLTAASGRGLARRPRPRARRRLPRRRRRDVAHRRSSPTTAPRTSRSTGSGRRRSALEERLEPLERPVRLALGDAATSTRPAMRPRKPPGCEYSLR